MVKSMWRQKSRTNWLKQGDKNTRYFQAIANNRFRKNMMGSIKANGRVVVNPEEIKEADVEHFKANFIEDHTIRPGIEGEFRRRISPEVHVEI